MKINPALIRLAGWRHAPDPIQDAGRGLFDFNQSPPPRQRHHVTSQ
jgi:hypothetical protein